MGTLIPFIPVSCITFFIQISLSSIMVAVEVAPTSAVTSTSASNSKSRLHGEDVATDHLLEGKRYMLVKDYANAVESLALACEALSSQHGETATECADAYFHYGKALLELGRMESGVLGNALEGVPEEEASGEGSEKVESTEKMTEDLNSCLEKRKDKLPEERRQIAETMYQLGVALTYHEQFDEAVKYFNDSIAVITKHIETMKADSLTASVSEIGELEKLAPEIREKIQDTMSCKEESAKRMKEGGDGGFSGSSSKPASSIETKRK